MFLNVKLIIVSLASTNENIEPSLSSQILDCGVKNNYNHCFYLTSENYNDRTINSERKKQYYQTNKGNF